MSLAREMVMDTTASLLTAQAISHALSWYIINTKNEQRCSTENDMRLLLQQIITSVGKVETSRQ